MSASQRLLNDLMAVEDSVPFGSERQSRSGMHVFRIGPAKSALDVWKEIEARTRMQMAQMSEGAGDVEGQEKVKAGEKKIRWAPHDMVYEPKEVEPTSESSTGQSRSSPVQDTLRTRVEAWHKGPTRQDKGKAVAETSKIPEHLMPEGNRQVWFYVQSKCLKRD